MKLLMVLDGVDFPLAPNPRLACRVAWELAEMGHTVHILYMAGFEKDLPALPSHENLTLLPLLFPAEAQMEQILEHGARGGTPVIRRLARLAAHPLCAEAAFRRIVLHRPARIERCRRKIELYCARNCYDAVLTVNAPYHSAEALMNASVGAKRLVWEMDPLADSPTDQGPRAANLEFTLCQKADGLFITREIERLCCEPGRLMSNYRRKIAVLDFPSFVAPESQPLAPAKVPDAPTRVVFVGSLYEDLRTPHFALELFEALDLPGVELTLVGGGWENYPPELPESARQKLGDRLRITGPLAPDAAEAELEKADILLNLGNASDTQLPSKIFEYFSTCKPVLTLAKSPTDPSLPYLEKYPLSLTIQEAEGLEPAVLEKVRDFLAKNACIRCDSQQVARLFEANTPRAVARAFLEGLESCTV